MRWTHSTIAFAAALTPAAWAAAAWAAAWPSPRQMDGFKTCADVDKAAAEGSLMVYSPDPETNQVTDFKLIVPDDWDAFLKTHTQFVREWDRMTGIR